MDTKRDTRRSETGATRTATQNKRTRQRKKRDVVYTQPGPFNRDRFLLRLVTVVAVVLAVTFGMSIFFKVDENKILISGMEKYTAYDVRVASGIQAGENLLTLRKPEISGRIMKQLPYVSSVRVGIKLPDTVNIEIVETDVVYAAEATDGTWWLLRCDGTIVDKTNETSAQQYTILEGITLTDPAIGSAAAVKEPEPVTDETTGETVPVTVTAAEQLSVAIQIAQSLEDTGIIGNAKSIDVSKPENYSLWYEDRYQVLLGQGVQIEKKIRMMKAAIDKMQDYASGTLDVSFEIMPDQVVYTPFA